MKNKTNKKKTDVRMSAYRIVAFALAALMMLGAVSTLLYFVLGL